MRDPWTIPLHCPIKQTEIRFLSSWTSGVRIPNKKIASERMLPPTGHCEAALWLTIVNSCSDNGSSESITMWLYLPWVAFRRKWKQDTILLLELVKGVQLFGQAYWKSQREVLGEAQCLTEINMALRSSCTNRSYLPSQTLFLCYPLPFICPLEGEQTSYS